MRRDHKRRAEPGFFNTGGRRGPVLKIVGTRTPDRDLIATMVRRRSSEADERTGERPTRLHERSDCDGERPGRAVSLTPNIMIRSENRRGAMVPISPICAYPPAHRATRPQVLVIHARNKISSSGFVAN